MKDQSLIDPDTLDYAFPDIVNYVLRDGKNDGLITKASQLNQKQAQIALRIYIKEYNQLKRTLEKAIDVLHSY